MRMAVDDIAASASRTAHILQSVRDIFANREPAHERVDVNALVRETVAFSRAGLASSDIGVQLQLAERPPVIIASRPQVQEVLLNLLNNAAESMRGVTDHAAVLRISTAAVGPGRLEIAVADTGAGIDEKLLARIFEPFFTTKPSGLGMGLAICKSIVERHGGTLSASCGEPYGAVFRVQFPSQE
jgi:C4-dicarboxylate-specific signal transduction histidine kinase